MGLGFLGDAGGKGLPGQAGREHKAEAATRLLPAPNKLALSRYDEK